MLRSPTLTTAKRYLTTVVFALLHCKPSSTLDAEGPNSYIAWDRAYDESGDLCYICYHDAGKSVYAGFMKSILTPEDRRELYNGVTNPRQELLGDTLELALGILTMAIRYPNHFINWRGSDGANACVRGIERSVWRVMPQQRPSNCLQLNNRGNVRLPDVMR